MFYIVDYISLFVYSLLGIIRNFLINCQVTFRTEMEKGPTKLTNQIN